MTTNKNHNARNTFLIFLYIAIAIALIVVVIVVPRVNQAMKKTVVIKHGELPIIDKADALVVREETLFLSEKSGTIKDRLPEGTKVRTGVHILNVDSGSTEGAKEYTQILENSSNNSQFTNDFNANFTSIVSYYSDGLEKKWTLANMDDISKDDIASAPKKLESLEEKVILSGQPIYKLVDNNTWYMVFFIENDGNNTHFDQGKSVKVNIDGTSIEANVYSIKQKDDGFQVILQCNRYFEDMAKYRRLDIDVVSAEYSGLIVPQKSLYTKGKEIGVWAQQEDKSFKWIRVKVLRQAKGKAIISASTFYDEKGKIVQTVSYYETVLVDPKAEGY